MNDRLAEHASVGPLAFLKEAVSQLPAMRYAIGVGGIGGVISLVLAGWKVEPQIAILGGIVVLVGMAILLIFAALAKENRRSLRPLALTLAWSFLVVTLMVTGLFISCAFFSVPKTLPCLLRGECEPASGRDLAAGVQPPNETGTSGGPSTAKSPGYKDQVAEARSILKGLYDKKHTEIYEKLAPIVQSNIPFAVFRSTALAQTAQIEGGPLRRTAREPVRQGAFLYVPFDAEFDQASTWMEGITFVETEHGWRFYRLDLQPREWSSAVNARVLPDARPSMVIDRIAQGEASDSFIHSWVPAAGWRVRVDAVGTRRADRTCDVRFRSENVFVRARALLGGCALKPGVEIDLVGRLSGIEGSTIELEAARYQPVP